MNQFQRPPVPHIGMRVVKTAVAVMISYAIFAPWGLLYRHELGGVLGQMGPLYACIACIVCIQSSLGQTVRQGVSRFIGVLVGGALGAATLLLGDALNNPFVLTLALGVLTVAGLWICLLLQRPAACAMACIVPCVILITGVTGVERYYYAAARLIDCGIPLSQLNKRHFRTKTLRRLQVESAIVRSMELLDGGRTALAFISLDLLAQTGADERDLDDIANFVGQIEGVCNAATLRELSPGRCKLSLRTDPGDLNASAVCALLGGGGHAAAAGATMEGTLQQAREAVLRAIEQVQAHG